MNTTHKNTSFAAAGKRLRKVRDDLGLSQKSVAKFIGTTQSNYSKIERGSFPPNKAHLILLRDNFKINPDWILYGATPVFLEEAFVEHFLIPIITTFPDTLEGKWYQSLRPAAPNDYVFHPALTKSRQLIAVRMPDNSMSPMFSEGDIIILDPALAFEKGAAALPQNGSFLVRNVRPLENGRLLLWPSNPDYDNREEDSEQCPALLVPIRVISLNDCRI